MKNDNWHKVEEIFHQALTFERGERSSYLEQSCSHDPLLLDEINSLITSFENDIDFMESPVDDLSLSVIHQNTEKTRTDTTLGFYQIGEKIGSGGMGEVYAAIDTKLNRKVALKFLSDSFKNDSLAKRQLRKEAQAIAMLEHPNICAVYGIEEIEDDSFIVMQFLEGTTLEKCLNNIAITPQLFKSLAKQIVEAVAFAHSHGVIHRDLKPGNIMLSNDGNIKVLDFGLAKIVGQQKMLEQNNASHSNQVSQSGLVIGTISYMSPEQLRGEKLDYQTDIFSLGIIFYELLAKQNPFHRKTQAETIAAILSDSSITAANITQKPPSGIVNLVDRCLEKDRNKRFQSTAEILIELESTESETLVRSNAKQRRNFFVKSALAAVVLVIVFATGLFFFNSKRAQRTVAVLPISFEDAPGGKEYLADGLTQSIIEKLSNLTGLRVKSEFIVNRYKGKIFEPLNAGKELNVDAVLVGTIKNGLDGLVLETKLIRVSNGELIDPYESKIDEANLIELPQNIAFRIVDKIQSNLTDDDKNKIAKKDTEIPEAKRLYIRGRYYLERQEWEDLKNAERDFRDATNLDPLYAKAWTGLADTYTLFSVPGHKGSMAPEQAAKSAKAAAKRAIEIDDSLCEPYVSLGMIQLRYDWEWKEAESNFRAAINRNSEFPQAHLGLSNLLIIKRDYAGSIDEAKKAREFSPFSVVPYLSLARSYYFEKDYERMEKVLTESLELFPNHKRLRYFRGLQYLATGKLQESAQIFEKIYQEDKVYGAAPLGLSYGRLGRKDDARNILAVLDDLSKKEGGDYVAPQEKAIVHLGLGEIDKVFDYLNKACQERYPAFPFVTTDPIFDELRTNSSFAGLKVCANL